MRKHPKLLRWILKETQFSKAPTDEVLDAKISYISWVLRSVYPVFWEIVRKKFYRILKYRLLSIRFWWQLIRSTFFILLIAGVGGASVYYVAVFTKEKINPSKKEVQVLYYNKLKSFEELVTDIGKKESSNDWQCTRPGSQYIGWFQFGNSAFAACKTIGLNIDLFGRDKFLKSPSAQITWFSALIMLNKKSLEDIVSRWNNKNTKDSDGNWKIEGFDYDFTITESGILMGAHLCGASDCRTFFESGGKIIPKDGNGTPITKYIKEFSGYDVDNIIY